MVMQYRNHLNRIWLWILCCLALTTVSGQQNPLGSFVVKKGIYTSFLDIRSNTPTIDGNFRIIERTKGNIMLLGGGANAFEWDSLNRNDYRKLRKELIGVSDGHDFYISDRFTIGGWQGITKCGLEGPNILAPIKGSAGLFTGGGILPGIIKIDLGYIINLKSGSSSKLTNKYLNQLLAKYPAISNQYKNADNLTDYAIDILQKINELEATN